MKDLILKDKVKLFCVISMFYLVIAAIFFTNTTIFYDTNETYNVLLDTDTGVLFKWNTFALYQDNSKHILFSQFVSLLAFPIFVISKILSNFCLGFTTLYGGGLILLQIFVSSLSIVMIYDILKRIEVKEKTLILLIVLMTLSFPQIFMTVNIERFIYGQLSLVLFMFILTSLKDKESYIIDIAAIPLFGITLTNIYLYGLNLILQFKFNIKKILKHLTVFSIVSYIILISTKSYIKLFQVSDIIESDSAFLIVGNLIEKVKMTILRLIYPIFYFPGYDVINNKMVQNGRVNKIYLILILIIMLIAIISALINYKDRVAQLCLGIIMFNIFLHGIIGFNLNSANIMTIHFSFAVIILLGYFSKYISDYNQKFFNLFLIIIVSTIIFSNLQGFIEIFKLGIKVYPLR